MLFTTQGMAPGSCFLLFADQHNSPGRCFMVFADRHIAFGSKKPNEEAKWKAGLEEIYGKKTAFAIRQIADNIPGVLVNR
jgi:hypothetical protein